MQNSVARFTKSARRGLDRVNSAVNSMGRGIRNASLAITAAGAAVTASMVGILKQFSKIEDAEAAFTPLLGGADRAKLAVAELNKTAASTPFQFETLAGSMQQLLPVMNGDIQNTIATMRMLGDTAGGNAQKLDTITRGYTKAMLKGKVDLESLNMIAEAGVPIYNELAASLGVTTDKMFAMVSAGKVAPADLTRGFQRMTREGGIFYNGMEIASRTLSGRFSTLKDNISQVAAELGDALAPEIKELTIKATEVAQTVKAWIIENKALIRLKFEQTVKKIGDAIGWVVKHRDAIVRTAKTVGVLIVVLKSLAVVMAIVNAVMIANPIGLIVVAIAALIAAVAALIIWWDKIKEKFLSFPAPVKAALMIVLGPLGMLAGAAMIIQDNWGGIQGFFTGIFDAIGNSIDYVWDKMKAFIDFHVWAVQQIADVVPFWGDDEIDQAPRMRQNRPQTQTAASAGNSSTMNGEVVIRDETGKAQATKQPTNGVGLRVHYSGGF